MSGVRDAIERFLDERIAAGELPGAAWGIVAADGSTIVGCRGARSILPRREPATADTVYDLASLTKPLATAALAVLLARDGRLGPEDPAGRWLPELAGTDKEALTLSQLAAHSSGLPAWLPLYVTGGGADGYIRAIAAAPLVSRPGAEVLYSDCGYVLLGEAVARAGGASLDDLFRSALSAPLGLRATRFRPPASWRERIAPTERDCRTERDMVEERGLRYDGWRKGIIRGEVHDGNARGLGGVSGHAGLFGTVGDLLRIGREFVGRGEGLFSREELEIFARPLARGAEVRTFGWQSALTAGSAGEGCLPGEAFGHTGFTGTSIWLDPLSGSTYVLLTNRIHPDNTGIDMNALRREFHRLARRVGPARGAS